MKGNLLTIFRHSEDGLAYRAWFFEVKFPYPTQEPEISLRLVAYEEASRASKRHRKYEPSVRRMFGRHYEGMNRPVLSWKDAMNGYGWDTGDLRWSHRKAETPELPEDVAEEARSRVQVKLVVAGAEGDVEHVGLKVAGT